MTPKQQSELKVAAAKKQQDIDADASKKQAESKRVLQESTEPFAGQLERAFEFYSGDAWQGPVAGRVAGLSEGSQLAKSIESDLAGAEVKTFGSNPSEGELKITMQNIPVQPTTRMLTWR